MGWTKANPVSFSEQSQQGSTVEDNQADGMDHGDPAPSEPYIQVRARLKACPARSCADVGVHDLFVGQDSTAFRVRG